mgnify:CR=1 FL=1
MINKQPNKAVNISPVTVFLATTKNDALNETIDNLLTGTSDGDSNFICTSPVRNRAQHYYAYNKVESKHQKACE